jgi:hypothetical protein
MKRGGKVKSFKAVLPMILIITSLTVFLFVATLGREQVTGLGLTLTRYPTRDTDVTSISPDDNGNSLSYNMYNGWNPTYGAERIYLQFNISSVPAGQKIENATLSLMSKYGPSYGAGYTDTWHLIDVFGVDNDNWLETTLTWNIALAQCPPVGPVLDTDNFQADGFLIGSTSRGQDSTTGQYARYYWDVTSFVQSQYAGDKIVSLVLIRENENIFDPNTSSGNAPDNKESAGWFYTKDGGNVEANQPQLSITYIHLPGKPVLQSPTNGIRTADNTPTFQWTPGSYADNHRLLVDDDSDFSSPEENMPLGAADNTYTVTTPLAEENYSWKVIAINPQGETESNVWTFEIIVVAGVEVSISPGYQSGIPEATLIYTVTVTNTGNVPDTYTLENTDNATWTKSLSKSSVGPLAPDASENVTLTVTIHSGAENNARDNVRVKATSQTNNTVENSASCIAHVVIVRGVEVTIEPENKTAPPENTFTFTVSVTNTGEAVDNFDLTITDDLVWGATLSEPELLNVESGASENVTVSVTIPSGTAENMWTVITVTATSRADPSATGSGTCRAIAGPIPPPPPPPPDGGLALPIAVVGIAVGGGIAVAILLKMGAIHLSFLRSRFLRPRSL